MVRLVIVCVLVASSCGSNDSTSTDPSNAAGPAATNATGSTEPTSGDASASAAVRAPALLSDATVLRGVDPAIRPMSSEEITATARLLSSDGELTGDLVMTYVTVEPALGRSSYSAELSDGTRAEIEWAENRGEQTSLRYYNSDDLLVSLYSFDLDGSALMDVAEVIDASGGGLDVLNDQWTVIGELAVLDYAEEGSLSEYEVAGGSVDLMVYEPLGDIITIVQYSPTARAVAIDGLANGKNVLTFGEPGGTGRGYIFQLDDTYVVEVREATVQGSLSDRDLLDIVESIRIIESPSADDEP